MTPQPSPPTPPLPAVRIIHLVGEPSLAFDLAYRAGECGLACARRIGEPLGVGDDDLASIRRSARFAAHLARRALGEL